MGLGDGVHLVSVAWVRPRGLDWDALVRAQLAIVPAFVRHSVI